MASAPVVCLVGSPLLGPTVWSLLDDRLRAAGRDTLVVATSRAASGGPAQVLADLLAQIPADTRVTLVAHSNAGAYIPAIATARRASALVFVDAILPASAGATPLAPPDFLAAISALADSRGLLPRWTQWWDPADIAALIPDAELRSRIEAEQPRIPLKYFRESIDAPAGWDDRPGAYIAFGDTYGPERSSAAGRGWDTRTLDGGHLAMTVDPDAVAASLLGVLADLGS